MAKGFIYTIATLSAYEQRAFCNVPTHLGNRLYFGPCKAAIRRRAAPEDYIFGLSPSGSGLRRIVFIAQVEERITFCDAYERFPQLRGPEGPIHVKPIRRPGVFPCCAYAHISGAMHPVGWEKDLACPSLDAFLVCRPQTGAIGCWLGGAGPIVDARLLSFLKQCTLLKQGSVISPAKCDATLKNPITIKGRSGKFLYRGLHLETERPEVLVELCLAQMDDSPDSASGVPDPLQPAHQLPARRSRTLSSECRRLEKQHIRRKRSCS